MIKTILSLKVSLLFIFFCLIISVSEAQLTTDRKNKEEDFQEETSSYEAKWIVDIMAGGIFENQRTAPLIVIDSSENVYLAGAFSETLMINYTNNIESRGKTDIFLIKFDKDGNLLWKKQAGGKGRDYVGSMRISKEGGIILSGYFEDSTSFDRIKTNIKKGGYVASYNEKGSVLWVKTENKTVYSLPQTDHELNFYLTESYKDRVRIDTSTIINPTRYHNSYLSKYNNKNKLQWFEIINKMAKSGRGEVKTSDMVIDKEGNIFLGGTFKYAPMFDNIQVRSGKKEDIFLAKYTPNGKLDWVLQLTNSDDQYEVDRVFFSQGDIFLRATAYVIENSDTIETYHQFKYNEQATSVEYLSSYGWETGEEITGDTLSYQYSSYVTNLSQSAIYKFGIVGNLMSVMKFIRRPLQNARREED